jgi:acyl carrier protein
MVEEKLKVILSNQLGVETSKIITENHIVNDLGADSLDIVEIIMDVENEFKIKIEDNEYQDANTVQLIINLIESKTKD